MGNAGPDPGPGLGPDHDRDPDPDPDLDPDLGPDPDHDLGPALGPDPGPRALAMNKTVPRLCPHSKLDLGAGPRQSHHPMPSQHNAVTCTQAPARTYILVHAQAHTH